MMAAAVVVAGLLELSCCGKSVSLYKLCTALLQLSGLQQRSVG
jgi:hypothetical protein